MSCSFQQVCVCARVCVSKSQKNEPVQVACHQSSSLSQKHFQRMNSPFLSLHRWITDFLSAAAQILSTRPPPHPSTTPLPPPCPQRLLTYTGVQVCSAKHVFICSAFLMKRRFWSLKHKSDVRQWAHGARGSSLAVQRSGFSARQRANV